MARHRNPRDKTAAQQWAQDMLARNKIYILDTETTGLGKQDEIVQLGIIDGTGAVVMDTLIKSTVPVPYGAMSVHGISNEMLADAPNFADIYTEISSTLAGATLIAYNMDFDWRMLQQTCNRYKLPIFRVKEKHCAMKQYAQYRGSWNNKRYSYKWHKLTDAVDYENLTVQDAHSAVGDILMTLALMRKMAEAD